MSVFNKKLCLPVVVLLVVAVLTGCGGAKERKEALEAELGHLVGDVGDGHVEAKVGLVRSVALHRLRSIDRGHPGAGSENAFVTAILCHTGAHSLKTATDRFP